MARAYITKLFESEGAANSAKAALAALKDVTMHRAFVIHRDKQGFRVDGRYAGEKMFPKAPTMRYIRLEA